MDLKQRLTLLRTQRGDTATSQTATSAATPTPAPVEQRLQRLYGAGKSETTRKGYEPDVAHLLGGTQVADGLIVVEHQLPLSHQHGERRFTSLLTHPSLDAPTDPPLPTEHLVFMDTETTGLAGGTGTLAFLLGLGRIIDDMLCLKQFFLTGFRGEAALLRAASDWIEGREYLVTFNGKALTPPSWQLAIVWPG